ncbi:MAG: formyltransferase family protein [Candidatus Beckwithbacteria bacterium]|nr:formyltransferase family protein [Candidatus Beckwithbacteria bacterium]
MKNLAVLISNTGTGTNLKAIIKAIKTKKLKAKIMVVVGDTDKALGLKHAKQHNIPIQIIKVKDNLVEILKNKFSVDYVCLAGWKKIIPNELIKAFPNKIFNIHPGLIPNKLDGQVINPDGTVGLWNRGKLAEKAIENFLNKKATYAGSSVHWLSEQFDFGKVLTRCFEPIKPGDTVQSLYKRLKKKENKIYVESLISICKY